MGQALYNKSALRGMPGKLALLGMVAIIGMLGALALSSCTPTEEPPASATTPFFNQAGFSRDGQFYRCVEDGILAHKTGVDVSDHQGWIDWSAVKKHGIRFAYIRAGYRGSTEGKLFADDYFDYNMEGTKQAGIERGVYFFSQAVTAAEAREEAEFVLQLLDGEKLDYPIAFDFERSAAGIQSRVANLTSEEASLVARTFCNTIYAGGYEACIYGNGYDLGLFDKQLLDEWPLWYAEYGELPGYPEEFFCWQYSSVGVINGIDTEVDLNLDLSTLLEAD